MKTKTYYLVPIDKEGKLPPILLKLPEKGLWWRTTVSEVSKVTRQHGVMKMEIDHLESHKRDDPNEKDFIRRADKAFLGDNTLFPIYYLYEWREDAKMFIKVRNPLTGEVPSKRPRLGAYVRPFSRMGGIRK